MFGVEARGSGTKNRAPCTRLGLGLQFVAGSSAAIIVLNILCIIGVFADACDGDLGTVILAFALPLQGMVCASHGAPDASGGPQHERGRHCSTQWRVDDVGVAICAREARHHAQVEAPLYPDEHERRQRCYCSVRVHARGVECAG